MEKTIISWSVPNLITIWLMLFAGLFAFALLSTAVAKRLGSAPDGPANNSAGY